ncbi:MAG TPA: dihydroneopterin aldolase [Sedimentisphaerales bacterium]|nr:dihydroneopterin aldolase [Sedimentisphaerales bacterium]HRS11018.1 dihydroneopterin aldolase [Sedimentisphaerales bacterium]HRV49266.1 dihydroneopterin aldolase [Sedimentisphaerales bacterium]
MSDGTGPLPLDQIVIGDLRFRCIVGVEQDERREKQDVITQIVLFADLRAAGRSDAIEDTVDYKALKKDILDAVERSQFRLIEALAQCIADICLNRDRVERVAVTVEKPGALRFARTVSVRIVRDRRGCNA